jgi:hypothetical protein
MMVGTRRHLAPPYQWYARKLYGTFNSGSATPARVSMAAFRDSLEKYPTAARRNHSRRGSRARRANHTPKSASGASPELVIFPPVADEGRQIRGGIIRRSARRASSVRLVACSLTKRCFRCVWTVCSVIPSLSAISRSRRPSTTRRRTSSSRGVRLPSSIGPASPGGPPGHVGIGVLLATMHLPEHRDQLGQARRLQQVAVDAQRERGLT